MSLTVTVNEQVAVKPAASVTLYVSVVLPLGKVVEPGAKPAINVVVAPVQLSVPAGAVHVAVPKQEAFVLTAATVGQVIAGTILSVTVTVNEQVVAELVPSVPVN